MGNIFASLPCAPVPVEIVSSRRLIQDTNTLQSLGLQNIGEEPLAVAGNDKAAEATRQKIRSELCVPIAVDLLETDRSHEWISNEYKRYYYPVSGCRLKVRIDLETILRTHSQLPSRNSQRSHEPPPIRNIFVAGAAGSGKSHLFMKIVPFMWANGWLWANMLDLVACFDLCREDVCQANDMAQLLSTYLQDKVLDDGECSAAYFSQAGHGERLCLIFDGLSECVVEDCSEFMRDVLCRRKWRTASVIVLSRQLTDAIIVDQHKSYDYFLQVTGLAPDAFEPFIKRRLIDDQAQLFLHGDETSDRMTVPLMALSTCKAVEAGMERPLCLTAAMECSVLLAIERAGRGSYKSLQEIPDDVYVTLSHLSRFALESLMDRRYAFRLAHLEEANLGLPSPRLHLLNPCQDISAIWFRFSSVSVQEFLSAWYLSTHFFQSSYHTAALVERLDHRTGHLDMLWHYLIAMLPTPLAGSIADQVWVKARNYRDKIYVIPRGGGQVIRDLLQESSSEPLCEIEVDELVAELQVKMETEKRQFLANVLLGNSSFAFDSGHQLVLANLPAVRWPNGTAYLKTMMVLWQQRQVRNVQTAARFYEALRDVDRDAANACKSRLLPDWLVGGSIEELEKDFEYMISGNGVQRRALLHILEAYHEHRLLHPTSVPPRQFRAVDQSMPGVGIDIAGEPLSPRQCAALSFIYASYPDSKGSLDLKRCRISNVGLKRFVPALLASRNLVWLDLEECDITDATPLVAVLHYLKDLQQLKLSKNYIRDGGLALLEPALLEMKSLDHATFSHAGLTGASLPVLTRLISAWPRMRWLELERHCFNSADAEAQAEFVEAIRGASLLYNLDLSSESLRRRFQQEINAIQKKKKEIQRQRESD